LDLLKAQANQANLMLPEHGLVIFTWGNVSGFIREDGLMVIKPSGVTYKDMRDEDMVLVELETRNLVGGSCLNELPCSNACA
jgi:L-ribulose-5-phosphate 4-epimerase